MSQCGAKREAYLDPPPELASFKTPRVTLSISREKKLRDKAEMNPSLTVEISVILGKFSFNTIQLHVQ
jgi:hypothetical protein